MTCIIGYVENDVVYIGSDSAGVNGWDIRIRKDEKIFKNGKMIFGCTSSFRMIQILRYMFEIPKHDKKKSDLTYLHTDFITALIKCLKDNEYSEVKDNKVSGAGFLFGYNSKLYHVYDDYQISIVVDGYDACGCGESYALGAMMSMQGEKMRPTLRIKKALAIAEYFSNGVCRPFNIIKLR